MQQKIHNPLFFAHQSFVKFSNDLYLQILELVPISHFILKWRGEIICKFLRKRFFHFIPIKIGLYIPVAVELDLTFPIYFLPEKTFFICHRIQGTGEERKNLWRVLVFNAQLILVSRTEIWIWMKYWNYLRCLKILRATFFNIFWI